MVLHSGIKTLDDYFREKEAIEKRDNWKAYKQEMDLKDGLSSDPVVNQVIDKLAQRSDIGISKYGCTLADSRLNEVAWLVHLQDELMDGANYAQVLINKLKEKPELEENKELKRKNLEREIAKLLKSQNNLYSSWSASIAKEIIDYLIGANII
jgi:hypothetical protein